MLKKLLTAMAGETVADARTGKNGRHALVGMLRQSVFGRLAGYEDVNDAERLRHDPAMRWIVGSKASHGCAASPSQMGRFETRWLTAEKNLSALADLSGRWIDCVHARRPPRGVVLDMDSSVSPTHGEQENSVWNGHYECTILRTNKREEETILDATRKAQCPPAKMHKLLIVDQLCFPRGIRVVMEFIGVVEKIAKFCDVRRVGSPLFEWPDFRTSTVADSAPMPCARRAGEGGAGHDCASRDCKPCR
jgi:hypothetical protein